MNWINLNVAVLDSEEFLGSTPTERGTWLCLLRYCVGQENGGRIEDAKQWKDRKWQQVVRVTGREVGSRCDLWTWEGDDLIVTFYPDEKEAEIRQKREIAKTNGARGGRPKKTDTQTNGETHKKPTLVISEKAEGEGKEKGKDKGSLERENAGEWDDDLDIGPKPYAVPPEPEPAPLPNHELTARRIVGRYPRQERIENALKIVYGHLIDGEDPKRMLAGTAAGAVVIRSATPAQERFVPSAEAYFRDKRWADDPQTLLRAQVREDRLPKAPRAGSSYGENTELPP